MDSLREVIKRELLNQNIDEERADVLSKILQIGIDNGDIPVEVVDVLMGCDIKSKLHKIKLEVK